MKQTILTKESFNKLQEELSNLKKKQEGIITQIEEVAQPDESCEDSLAIQLKEELELVIGRIEIIEIALETAKIITGKISNHKISVGSKVKLKIKGNSIKIFEIVSELEADPSQNKISDSSPLGQALLSKKLNESVEVKAPIGKITYKIIGIK
jgi:transcription elongation factor GreA